MSGFSLADAATCSSAEVSQITLVKNSAQTQLCIWCGGGGPFTVEHIIPESLGGLDWFVLNEGVCQHCNSALGTIDAAILKPFELVTVVSGIPRKGGKPPVVSSHSTFSSVQDANGPALFFNREKHKVQAPEGKALAPTSKKDIIQEFEFEQLENGKGKVTFRQIFIFDRMAVRALFKISLETIAFHAGCEYVRDEIFNEIRDFVRHGKGEFKALQYIGDGTTAVAGQMDGFGMGTIEVSLLGLKFVCDFDPKFSNGKNQIAISRLQNVWPAILPNSDHWKSA